MKISKVYYEELRSVCIGNKWTNKKIGVEVLVGSIESISECLNYAKSVVRTQLDLEVGIEDNKKYKKAFEKVKKSLQYEVDKIGEDDIPF